MNYILVIEDNPIQRKALIRILSKIIIGYNYKVLEADSISSAFQILEKYSIGLLFIDIELKDGSGLELTKEIRKNKEYEFTPIVFITSYSQFIVQAFKNTHCYDYLMKPYDEKEIEEITLKLLNSPLIKKIEKKFLKFNIQGIYIKIFLEDIFFIESFKKDCVIHTKHGKYNLKRTSLKNILDIVKQNCFIQCHRSYIVNTKLIEMVDTRDRTWTINFKNYDEVVYVGITFQDHIKKDMCTDDNIKNNY